MDGWDALLSALQQAAKLQEFLYLLQSDYSLQTPYQPTLDYFETILPFAADNAVFVFDDIRWSEGMKKAWAELQQDKRFAIVLDLCSVGIAIVDSGLNLERYVSPSIWLA